MVECLSGIIVTGMAFDYNLHFAHKYGEAGEDPKRVSRYQRCEHAFDSMGTAIFAGFATTFAAGIVLVVFCNMAVFSKLGAALVVTVASSVLTGLLWLPCLLLVLGPSGSKEEWWGQGAEGGWGGQGAGGGLGAAQHSQTKGWNGGDAKGGPPKGGKGW